MCTQSPWPSTAIIGVGQLGAAVAGNLIRNKVPLTLYDQRPDSRDDRRLSLSEIDAAAQDLRQPICAFCLGKSQIM